MIAAGVKLYQFELPLTHGTRRGMLVSLTTKSGETGWGEISPLPGFSRESFSEARSQSLEVARKWTDKPLFPSVAFGFSAALSDLESVISGKPLFSEHLDGIVKDVSLCRLLSGTDSEILEKAQNLSHTDHLCVKLKVGSSDIEKDASLTWKVAEILRGTPLRLDANRKWNLTEAVAFGRKIKGCSVGFIEEPVTRTEDQTRFFEATGISIAWDETLHTLDPRDVKVFPGLSTWVIKPSALGSISRVIEWANLARTHGLKVIVSSMYESGVGTRALAVLAGQLGSDVPAGLDPYCSFKNDLLITALNFQDGKIDSPMLAKTHALSVDLSRLQEIWNSNDA